MKFGLKQIFSRLTKVEIIWLVICSILMLISVVGDLLQPYLYQIVNNTVLNPSQEDMLKIMLQYKISYNDPNIIIYYLKDQFSVFGMWIGIMTAVSIGGIIFNIASIIISIKISINLMTRVRIEVYSNSMYLSLQDIDKFSTSSLLTRVNSDAYQVQNLLIMIFNILLKMPFYLVGGIVMSVWQSVELSSKVDGGANLAYSYLAIPLMVVIALALTAKSRPFQLKSRQYFDSNNKIMIENLHGTRVVKAFNLEQTQMNRFNQTNDGYKKYNIKGETLVSMVMPSMMWLVNLALDITIIIGGYSANKVGDQSVVDKFLTLSPGSDEWNVIWNQIKEWNTQVTNTITIVTTFTQYFMLIVLGFVLSSMVMFFYARGKVCATRISEVLEAKSTITSKENAQKIENNSIEFNNVTFRYNSDSKLPILENISFKINQGESLGIIGQTGSGKSTLVNLIPRLYDTQEGEVKISNINVKDLDLKSIKENISFAFQEKVLFKGTIRSNLQVGKLDATEEEMIQALKIAEAYDFVQEKEGKLDAIVEQKGSNFSGGQKQRLSIARAIVSNPKILIFDDSTSALDNITEKKLLTNIKKHLKDVTLVMVAQRVKSIKDMDNIIVLDGGKIIGYGTHNQLLKSCKTYKQIYDSQSTSVGE